MNKLVIGYFYSDLLNLYGDNGNVEIMAYRARKRNIDVEILKIGLGISSAELSKMGINFVFMGGGPDASQKEMYEDLVKNKQSFLKDYVESGGVGLYICGSYQLMGSYYKSADGSILDGINIFDFYTQHFGDQKKRCIGNTVANLNESITKDAIFNEINTLDTSIVGFENHGGRTFLGENVTPLAYVKKGFGNNGQDKTEGILYKNSIGTYFHGPFLSRNVHMADYLLAKSINLSQLEPKSLQFDAIIKKAHTASKNLRQ